MSKQNQLFLYEEVMLLALKDEEGTIASGTNYQYALAGAILAELLLKEKIAVEEQKKKKYAVLKDPTPLGDPVIDECLKKVIQAKRKQQLQTWVSRFSSLKNLKHRTARKLVERGIIRADEDKVLWLFTRKIYPEVDPEPERKMVERMRNAIFTDQEDIDPWTVVLISLADSTGLLKVVFDKKELKSRKKRIEQIVNGELTGKATKEAIQAMQAAVFVACIVPAIIATTTTAGH